MTSTRKRHGVADKWSRNGVYFTVCHCGRLFKHDDPQAAKTALKEHRDHPGDK